MIQGQASIENCAVYSNRRWLVVRAAHEEVRERWPVHMDKLDDGKRRFFMESATRRLNKKLHKRIVEKQMARAAAAA